MNTKVTSNNIRGELNGCTRELVSGLYFLVRIYFLNEQSYFAGIRIQGGSSASYDTKLTLSTLPQHAYFVYLAAQLTLWLGGARYRPIYKPVSSVLQARYGLFYFCTVLLRGSDSFIRIYRYEDTIVVSFSRCGSE